MSATPQPGEKLMFLAFKQPMQSPPVLSLQSLDLAAPNVTQNVYDVGQGYGALFTQASTLVDGDRYIATVQHAGTGGGWLPSTDCKSCSADQQCCADPRATGKGSGACYKVSSCDALLDPTPQHGVTFGYDLARGVPLFHFNTSICWHLAVDPDDEHSLLCLEERSANATDTNYVSRIDVRTGTSTAVGSFPSNLIVGMNDATFDAAARVFYALLAPPPPTHAGPVQLMHLCGMDVRSGAVVSNVKLPAGFIIDNMDWDSSTGRINAIVRNISWGGDGGTEAVSETEQYGALNATTGTFVAVGADQAYRKRNYTQINSAFTAAPRRTYFGGMFKQDVSTRAARLFLVGTDADTGAIVYEYERPGQGVGANFVDMEYYAPHAETAI